MAGTGKAGEELRQNIDRLKKQAATKQRLLDFEQTTLNNLNTAARAAEATLKEAEKPYRAAQEVFRSAGDAVRVQAAKVKEIGQEIFNIQKEIGVHEESLKNVDHILNAQKKNSKNGIMVTDHALIRFLERKFDLDLQELRREIVTDELKQKVECFGNGTYGPYVVKDNVVITVLPKGEKPTKPLRGGGKKGEMSA